jgi:hypothetical protein
MPTSLEKQITADAQEFLGAHAYYLTEGRIPTNVGDHSKHLHIHDFRQRDGSWEALFTIDLANVASEFLTEYVRELTKGAAIDAAIATKLGFIWLVHRSYRSWTERTPLRDKTFDRIEPVLSELSGNGAPLYDPDIRHDGQRQRLYDRTHSSMSKISSPIGRAATHVDIWLDDQKLDRVERRVVTEEDITAALLPLRERLDRQHRYPSE